MSVIFVVVPGVVMGWGAMCSVVTAAAGAAGYSLLKAQRSRTIEVDASTPEVTLPIVDSSILAESMAEGESFTVTREDIAATFSRAPDGRCLVHVSGEGKTQAELDEAGRDLIGRITQQFAYHQVITKMKEQGFTVAHEEVDETDTIRIRVTKYQ